MTEKELAEILRRNPDISIIGDWQPSRSSIAAGSLAEKFADLWAQLGGKELQREYRFAPPRRWRFDFALPEEKIAIEINGGVWSYGRHVRGRGYLNDREKINTAQTMGWRVFELGTGQVTVDSVRQILELVQR